MKNSIATCILLLQCLFILSLTMNAQDTTNNKFGKGIRIIAQDSSFALKFGARFQTLYSGVYNAETHGYTDKMLIRRARLKFEGFAYSPRLIYKIELGLSNSDIAGANLAQTSHTANVVLDAVLKYNFYKHWTIWFGQAKLPGNVERLISSSALQFVDRSYLNSRYNLDRDIGVQLHYNAPYVRLAGSIATGEGRNITVNNTGGYDYTAHLEWLPFGSFSGNSEHSASDLKREQDLKLMFGLTYDYNDHASREHGQTGNFLSEQRTLKTIFADAHLKYRGFSAMVEYADKQAIEGAAIMDETTGSFVESFFVGTGLNAQAGYLVGNNWEIAGRYTRVDPAAETQKTLNEQYTVGVSRYIVGHSLKVQSDATLIREAFSANQFMYRFQVEFSF